MVGLVLVLVLVQPLSLPLRPWCHGPSFFQPQPLPRFLLLSLLPLFQFRYEARHSSLKDIKRWEASSGKLYRELSAGERAEANDEIGAMLKGGDE